ncbi:MAG TPA: hypothetical protein VHS58_04115 [Acetobacteraceae bacterium]|jgi:hypothetical protein|nr:hypothetical protein [Acetobacteraceae bacterium]
MSINSVTQTIATQAPPPPPPLSSIPGSFQLANAGATAPNPTGGINPYQPLAADMQSTLLGLQEEGAGTSTSGTQTDSLSNGQNVAHAHHHHHHGSAQAQAQPASTGTPSA